MEDSNVHYGEDSGLSPTLRSQTGKLYILCFLYSVYQMINSKKAINSTWLHDVVNCS